MRSLLSSLFPQSCVHCGLNPILELHLCKECVLEISHSLRARPHSQLLQGCWSLGSYKGPLRSLICRGKYRPDRDVFVQLGRRLAIASYDLPDFDVITHVPTSRWRKLRRGFDQAELLSRVISAELGAPHERLLRRLDSTEQAGRNNAARRQGSSLRFSLQQKIPKRVLVVDDQITSGATMIGCATALLVGGAECVYAISVACSSRHSAMINRGVSNGP